MSPCALPFRAFGAPLHRPARPLLSAALGCALAAALLAPTGPTPMKAQPGGWKLEDQFWGPIGSMASVGERLFVTQGSRMLIIDGWRGTDPRVIGRGPMLKAEIWDLAVEGNLAALAAGDAGVVILDVSDPLAPREVARSSVPGFAQWVALAGGRLWVGGYQGLNVFALENGSLVPLWSTQEAVRDLASDGRVVAALLEQRASVQEMLVWGDGAMATDLPSDMHRVALDYTRGVAVAGGRVLTVGGRRLVVHDHDAAPPWAETARIEVEEGFRALSAFGDQIIAVNDFVPGAAMALRLPPSGPPVLDSRVAVPEWPESVWVADGAIAIGLVGGGLRLHDLAPGDGGGTAPVRAMMDLGPDDLRELSQRGGRMLLNGNWGHVWEAMPGALLGDGLPLAHRFDVPVVNPVDAVQLADTGNAVLAASHGPMSTSTIEVRDPGVEGWPVIGGDHPNWSVRDLGVMAPATPGGPSLVLASDGDRIYGADLRGGQLGAFVWQRVLGEHATQIFVDGQRLWLPDGPRVEGFERVGGSWQPFASLELSNRGPYSASVLSDGETLYILIEQQLSRWDIRDPAHPVEAQIIDLPSFAAFGWTDPLRRDELWVGTAHTLFLVGASADGMRITQELETPCQVTAWIPVTDGAFAPAWGCGVLALSRGPAGQPTTATATPGPSSTPTPPSPTAGPIAWRVYLPWIEMAPPSGALPSDD